VIYMWIAVLLALPFVECLCVDCGNSFAACENCYDSSNADPNNHICLDNFDYYSISANTIDFSAHFQCFQQKQYFVINSLKDNFSSRNIKPQPYRNSRRHNTLPQVIQV
jgi:hypothetical protein